MIAPLFVTDMATLKSRLRLSGAAQPDALAVIDECVERVRVGFYDALGVTRITDIKATAYGANATTAAGILRTKAANTEIKWVKACLLRELPTLFMDSSGATQEAWNEEGLTRTRSSKSIETEIKALTQDILAALSDLSGDDDSTSIVQVFNSEPDDEPKVLFEEIVISVLG